MAFRFREFPVYGDTRQFVKEIYELTKSFPKEEIYGLTSQIRRASISVALNIAEGSAKGSDADFHRYLMQSWGSVNEVVGCLDIALDLCYINESVHKEHLAKAESLAKQLNAFSQTLLKSKKSRVTS